MKNKLINAIVILLLISGIFLLSLPTIRDYQSEKKTQQMITEYEKLIPEETTVDNLDNVKGMFIISDKIDLKMPIVNGATFDNMKDSVATIRHDTIQEGKNYSIAGHRYIRHGRHFNRIDELENGDILDIVSENGEIIKFSVYDKLVVEPDNIEVLDDNDITEITLVTCHPPGISSHRLIVKAKEIK